MFGLNPNNNKIIKLLKDSKGDFKFDKAGVKNRLLSSIEARHLHPKTFSKTAGHNNRLWNSSLASCLGLIVIFTATFVYADSSNPGDKLYFLDQLQERVQLKMPRSAESKAKLQEHLVKERVTELNNIPTVNHVDPNLRIKAIEESQQNLHNAVEETTKIRESLKLMGQDKSVENIDEVLLKLGELAEKQEQRVEEFKKFTEDKNDTLKLEENLEAIKKARLKARQETDKRGVDPTEEDNSDPRIEFKGPPVVE